MKTQKKYISIQFAKIKGSPKNNKTNLNSNIIDFYAYSNTIVCKEYNEKKNVLPHLCIVS